MMAYFVSSQVNKLKRYFGAAQTIVVWIEVSLQVCVREWDLVESLPHMGVCLGAGCLERRE